MKQSLGDRLNDVLLKLLMLQETSAVDYSRDRISQGRGGHGAHGDPSRRPGGNARPLVQQWAERFERTIEEAERDAGTRSVERTRTVKGATNLGLRQRIHEYEGRDPVWVAFIEGCSVQLIRDVRKSKGLNMVTGERMGERKPVAGGDVDKDRDGHMISTERPLTAKARDSLQILQDTIGGEV